MFYLHEMYQFISKRFVGTSGDIQRQALQWLQKLCLLKIPIPIPVLLEMFNAGVDTLKEDAPEAETEPEGNEADEGGDEEAEVPVASK